MCHSGEIPHAGGSFLKETTKFDNVEFGVGNKDAKSMTASTRRLIELSFLALLDAGIDSRGKKIGSFMTGTNVEGFERVSCLVFISFSFTDRLCRTKLVTGVC